MNKAVLSEPTDIEYHARHHFVEAKFKNMPEYMYGNIYATFKDNEKAMLAEHL